MIATPNAKNNQKKDEERILKRRDRTAKEEDADQAQRVIRQRAVERRSNTMRAEHSFIDSEVHNIMRKQKYDRTRIKSFNPQSGQFE
jgi:hypothetical protein